MKFHGFLGKKKKKLCLALLPHLLQAPSFPSSILPLFLYFPLALSALLRKQPCPDHSTVHIMPRVLKLVWLLPLALYRHGSPQGHTQVPKSHIWSLLVPDLFAHHLLKLSAAYLSLHDLHDLATSPNTPQPLCWVLSSFHSFIQASESLPCFPAFAVLPVPALASLCFLCWGVHLLFQHKLCR